MIDNVLSSSCSVVVPRTLPPATMSCCISLPVPGGVSHVWRLRTSGTVASTSLEALDEYERKRHDAFVRDGDRMRYAAAHLGLRRLLGAYLDLPLNAITFTREPCSACDEPHGRPTVHGSGLHFSLSRSGDMALFAFAAAPVGIDVEQVQQRSHTDDVAWTLHPRERAELTMVEDRLAVLRCWTRKEAYLKGTGEALCGNPALHYVGAGREPAVVHGWSIVDITSIPGYTAAVASRME